MYPSTRTSSAPLAEELGFSVKQIRTALNKLKSTGEVASESTNRYTIITVVNWEKYQVLEFDKASEWANKGQAEGKQGANKGQHLKNVKNNKECKEINIGVPPEPSEEDWRERAGR